MILYVCETKRANGKVLFDHGHLDLGDAVDEAFEVVEVGDQCCEQNDGEDDFRGPCPGGCEIRTPRIVKFKESKDTRL